MIYLKIRIKLSYYKTQNNKQVQDACYWKLTVNVLESLNIYIFAFEFILIKKTSLFNSLFVLRKNILGKGFISGIQLSFNMFCTKRK